MANKINFTKMVASGNDFVIIENREPKTKNQKLPFLAKNICDRKFGVGADGLLVLEKSKIADIRMRIFNADGSEAEMCGNGARCVALWLAKNQKPLVRIRLPSARSKIEVPKTDNREPITENLTIQTKAGIIMAQVKANNVKIKMTEPKNIKLNLPIKVNNRTLHVNFINTGVPHTVIFVEGLEKIDVFNLGRMIRYHKRFSPQGTNVDFVEVLKDDSISLRTYERGVEDETLACGTGAVASAIIFNMQYPIRNMSKINVYTKSGQILIVYFKRTGNKFSEVWLEGKARMVFKGEFIY